MMAVPKALGKETDISRDGTVGRKVKSIRYWFWLKIKIFFFVLGVLRVRTDKLLSMWKLQRLTLSKEESWK